MNSNAEKRRRELANFEIDTKSSGKRTGASGKKSASKGSASASAKTASTAKKNSKTTSAASKGGTQARSSASKKQNTKAPAKKDAGAKKSKVQENPLARRSSAVLQAAAAPSGRIVATSPAKRPAQKRSVTYQDIDALFDAPETRRPKAETPSGKGRQASSGKVQKKRSAAHSKKKKSGRRKKKVSGGSIAAVFILLMGIAAFSGLGYWRHEEYKAFAAMKEVVAQQTFYEGTTVEGYNVSGLSLPQAVDYWKTQVEPAYRETAAVLNDGTRITAAQMGYTSDFESVLFNAWNAGRSGTLEERYQKIMERTGAPVAFNVSRSMYNSQTVQKYAQSVAAQVDSDPVDAKVASFDVESYEFTFSPEKIGHRLNQYALVSGIENALNSGGGSVDLEIEALYPKQTVEGIQGQYGMITQAVTNASSSNSNRLSNIKLALSSINGYCLEPGETFSFNEAVGQRTTARGYKKATAYSSGEVTEQVGGGICQVSTTLFNAVVKADLKVKERHNHSLTVSYVDLGKDAAVNWGSQDFRFENTSDDNIYLVCYMTNDKRVRIGVFGKLLEDGMTITLQGRQTGTIDFETQYQLNMTMRSGEQKIAQPGKNGFTATTHKIYWDANGNEIKREELCKSRYLAQAQIIEYGP